MRLLVIDDNLRLASLLCEGLQEQGFATDHSPNLGRAEDALAVMIYDAMILDLGLPDGDGITWLRSMRRRGALPPVLILTARTSLGDRITGLDSGADDYLVKPFEIDEVAARVRAIMRRPGRRLDPVLKVGSLTFDPSTRSACVNGAPLDLTRRESDLLEVLMRRPGCVLKRAAIEDAIYQSDSDISVNAIEATVSRLRRKLMKKDAEHLLVTRRGEGYALQSTPLGDFARD